MKRTAEEHVNCQCVCSSIHFVSRAKLDYLQQQQRVFSLAIQCPFKARVLAVEESAPIGQLQRALPDFGLNI